VGCTFAPRCPRALDRCRSDAPVLEPAGDGRVACWNQVVTA
jgi:ABC-type dipeptide/oligopeptide/nickel transport system ATPase component